MHLMQKCCVFCFAKNKDAALTFCLQNVRKRQNAFWLCKNAFDAKMHLMRTFCFALQKCICNILCYKMYASNAFLQRVHFTKSNVQHHIFQRKMFSITFDFVKCSASHFPKENVQLVKY